YRIAVVVKACKFPEIEGIKWLSVLQPLGVGIGQTRTTDGACRDRPVKILDLIFVVSHIETCCPIKVHTLKYIIVQGKFHPLVDYRGIKILEERGLWRGLCRFNIQ